MKYIEIAEDNIMTTIQTNVIQLMNLLKYLNIIISKT